MNYISQIIGLISDWLKRTRCLKIKLETQISLNRQDTMRASPPLNRRDRSPTGFCQQLGSCLLSSRLSLDGAISSNIPTTECSHQWNAKLREKKNIFILFDGICYARVYPLWKMKGYFAFFLYFSCWFIAHISRIRELHKYIDDLLLLIFYIYLLLFFF